MIFNMYINYIFTAVVSNLALFESRELRSEEQKKK